MRRALAIACLLVCTGCGTIIKGGRQDVVVASNVPDAEVAIKSSKGETVYTGPPGKVTLHRENHYTVTVTAPGYRERKVTISRSLSGWAFGNLIWIIPILWGVGIAVDAASGALWSLDPDDLNVSLLKAPETPKSAPAPAPTEPTKGDFGF